MRLDCIGRKKRSESRSQSLLKKKSVRQGEKKEGRVCESKEKALLGREKEEI